MYFIPQWYWVTVKPSNNVQVGTHLQNLRFSYVCAKSQKLKGWPTGVNNRIKPKTAWCQKFSLYILWLQPPIAASRGRMKKLTYFIFITHPILLNSGDHCKRFATPLLVLYYSIFTSVYSSSCWIAIFLCQFIVLNTILWQVNTIRNFDSLVLVLTTSTNSFYRIKLNVTPDLPCLEEVRGSLGEWWPRTASQPQQSIESMKDWR